MASSKESHGFTNAIVKAFLHTNLPLVLILLATAVGVTSLMVTPREEDPQIVVPMADIYVNFPGHSAKEVEQLVATPLENLMRNIDGVEYVYSMSRPDQAIITVRYYVGQDRERSLVKLHKKIDENVNIVPPGVTGWVVKPVEIDDVPIVTLALTSKTSDEYTLRRVAEELVQRLSTVDDISRAYVIGGLPRTLHLYLSPQRMEAYNVTPLDVQRALAGANITVSAGDFTSNDKAIAVEAGRAFQRPEEVKNLVIGVSKDSPVFLKDVADVLDGPAEAVSYVRHGWGPGKGFGERPEMAGSLVGQPTRPETKADDSGAGRDITPAVTIALAKKQGTNAVTVSQNIIAQAQQLKKDVVPDDIQMVITRNAGLSSNDKVNELIEALAVALVLAVVVLTVSLGWRESLIVALAVPVVFGLTLLVNLLAGLTINRVTLFALILSLGLLVDDPIVDVENIVRHFRMRRKATRGIVLEAVAEIRPPLIAATFAVILSFVPLFFITGMMGPYMRPMALNVPVTMVMSMVVAFTITPWLTYHILRKRYNREAAILPGAPPIDEDPHGLAAVKKSALYRVFSPLMSPLLKHRWAGWAFLGGVGVLFILSASLAMTRHVPLKMLPYGNSNNFQLLMDMDEGTTLERTDALVREMEQYLQTAPEVTDFTSDVGLAAPMDFNGMVRHYYLRQGPHVADIQVNLVDRHERSLQTHGLTLRMRDDLTAIATRHGARLKIVEAPPGPPVLSTVVAEVYARPDQTYNEILAASKTVAERLRREPGVKDVDTYVQAPQEKLSFVTDKEKAALAGVSVADIAQTIQTALGGTSAGTVQLEGERNPLVIQLHLPRAVRSTEADLLRLHAKGTGGSLVSLAELGHFQEKTVDQTIYHKNLQPVMYVLAETVGRAPAEVVLDVQKDVATPASGPKVDVVDHVGSGWIAKAQASPVEGRTYFSRPSGLTWSVPGGIDVNFSGEGEWKLTQDVFRDMGLAFAAALVAIYILLVAQTRSFVIPGVVMMAIPLTIIGIMPGFWLLNHITGGSVGGFANPIFFTATGMIGMIALAGIVTRSSIIIVDFIHLSLSRGSSLFDAIINACSVRLRPILLTAGVAMLSALPIATDPIFSGLAWALIFGLLASTLFTLFVIPVIYWLVYANKPGHGVVVPSEND